MRSGQLTSLALVLVALATPARAEETPCVTCWSANCPEGAAADQPVCVPEVPAPPASPAGMNAPPPAPVEPTPPAGPTPPAAPAPPTRAELLDRACLAGSAKSCAKLGREQVREAYHLAEHAADQLELACRRGDMTGCIDLAELYVDGLVIPPTNDRPRELLTTACEAHEARACRELARWRPPDAQAPEEPPPQVHAHALLGWGLNWSLPTGGRQVSLNAFVDDGRNASFLLSLASEHIGAAEPDAPGEPVSVSLSNISLSGISLVPLGPLRFGFGWEVNDALSAAPVKFSGSPQTPVLSDRALGFAAGGSLAGGASLALGPVHAVVLARYRLIYGPAEGGWFLDLFLTPENWNCAD